MYRDRSFCGYDTDSKIMIRSRHTGINVSDLTDSLEFYVHTLGMTVVESRVEEGAYIDTLTGIKGTVQFWVKVSTDDGYVLELVEWEKPVPEEWSPFYEDGKPTSCDRYNVYGINHICFEVDDVQAVYDRLTDKNTIQTDPPGKVKNFSAYDPDGNIVEFVEVL